MGPGQEDVADTQGRPDGRGLLDPLRRARFQPLLLTGAFVAVLPTLLLRQVPARPVLLAAGVVFAGAGLAAWWWGRRGDPTRRHRERVALSLTGFAAPAFLAFVVVLSLADAPEPYLPLGAALVCAMAPVDRTAVRWLVQGTTLGVYAGLLVAADRGLADVLLPMTLLVGVTVLSSALARDLTRSRRAERAARHDAQRRAELLTTVRDLPGSTLPEAAAAACATMRSLGFDASGCAVLQGDELHTLHLDGLPDVDRPLRPGEGLAGRCLELDRTLRVGDYQADADRLDDRPQVGSAVVVPIRVEDRAVGVLMGARFRTEDPTDAEVEVAEVLAAHLGAVLATDETVRRQRELLTRMEQLESMRSAFVTQVSDELRDPLTVVRGIAATLARHADELDPDRRNRLFGEMADQTDQLRRTIDALLDFSRFQSTRPEAAVEVVPLARLLDPLLRSVDAELAVGDGWSPTTPVRADVGLVRHAVELLVAGTGVVEAVPQLRVREVEGGVELAVVADSEVSAAPALVRSLAAQLLVVAGAELAGTPAVPVVRLTVPQPAVSP